MKILLVNPPDAERGIPLGDAARVEPLGLEAVGAAVVDEHEVRLVDMLVRPEDLDATLAEWTPDVVGVTSEMTRVDTAIAALARVRRSAPQCLTVVGGRHATLCPEDFDDPAVDLVVLGEGADAFAEVCQAQAVGSGAFEQIAGLQIRSRSGTRKTKPRPLPKTLDHQPAPARWLADHYRDDYFYRDEVSVAMIRTSLGCNHPCSFCISRAYSRASFIPRAPELVFEEIRDLDADFVMLCDDQAFLDPGRMRILGQMLLGAGVKKRFFAFVRAEAIVEYRSLFALWAEVGLARVMTGLGALEKLGGRGIARHGGRAPSEAAARVLADLGIRLDADVPVSVPERTRQGGGRSERAQCSASEIARSIASFA